LVAGEAAAEEVAAFAGSEVDELAIVLDEDEDVLDAEAELLLVMVPSVVGSLRVLMLWV
jgi:hypothetical protein